MLLIWSRKDAHHMPIDVLAEVGTQLYDGYTVAVNDGAGEQLGDAGGRFLGRVERRLSKKTGVNLIVGGIRRVHGLTGTSDPVICLDIRVYFEEKTANVEDVMPRIAEQLQAELEDMG